MSGRLWRVLLIGVNKKNIIRNYPSGNWRQSASCYRIVTSGIHSHRFPVLGHPTKKRALTVKWLIQLFTFPDGGQANPIAYFDGFDGWRANRGITGDLQIEMEHAAFLKGGQFGLLAARISAHFLLDARHHCIQRLPIRNEL